MAGIGMVAGADVYSQPRPGRSDVLATPAGWSFFWFAVSFAYLLLIYTGMFTISR